MSISILQNITDLSLVHDQNPLVIRSTYSGETNFYYLYYIIDIDGVVSSLKQSPNPDGLGIFNPNIISKSKVSYNFNHTLTGITTSNGEVYRYKVNYGDVSDGSYDAAITPTRIITNINGVSRNIEYSNSAYNYAMSSSSSKFLSDCNGREIDIQKTDYYILSFINGYSHAHFSSLVKTINFEFNVNGSLTTWYLVNPEYNYSVSDFSFSSQDDKVVMKVGVGPMNLKGSLLRNSVGHTVILTDSFFDSLTSYRVYAKNDSGTVISQSVTFNMDCRRYLNKFQIFYMNSVGGFDSLTFNNGNWEDYSVKTQTYRKSNMGMVGNNYTYTNGNRSLTTLNRQIEKSLTVNTDFSMDEDIVLSLMLSSTHYLVDGTTIIPLVIDTEKHRKIDSKQSILNSYPITFNYSNKTNTNV